MKSLPSRTSLLIRPRQREEIREWRPIRRRTRWRSLVVLTALSALAAAIAYLQP